MEATRTDLGEQTDIAAVSGLMSVKGLNVVDVGCGPGKLSRELVSAGATVLGVEPDPIQAEKNRLAPPTPGLTFTEARAEDLPLESRSVDGVFFFRSLHHVPIDSMDGALKEAARILKPKTGFLCVAEPGMTGTHFQVMRPFNDETRVRTEAQAALGRIAARLFQSDALFGYVQFARYPDFEAMVTRVTGLTFIDIRRERVETSDVRSLFEAGRTDSGDYAFEQPMLLNLYQGPITATV